MTGFIAFGILELRRRATGRFELAITALLGLIFIGFLYETLKIGPSAHAAAGGLVPHLAGTESLYLAVGIIGATVMPHAIYLHSALTSGASVRRTTRSAARVLRFERLDVIIALGLAGRDQHEHAGRRRQALPRQRPHRRRHDPGRPRGLRQPGRRRRRARVRRRAARLRRLLLERRHLRRPGRDGRLHQRAHVRSTLRRVDDDGPRARRPRVGREPDQTRSCSARSCSRSGSRSR